MWTKDTETLDDDKLKAAQAGAKQAAVTSCVRSVSVIGRPTDKMSLLQRPRHTNKLPPIKPLIDSNSNPIPMMKPIKVHISPTSVTDAESSPPQRCRQMSTRIADQENVPNGNVPKNISYPEKAMFNCTFRRNAFKKVQDKLQEQEDQLSQLRTEFHIYELKPKRPSKHISRTLGRGRNINTTHTTSTTIKKEQKLPQPTEENNNDNDNHNHNDNVERIPAPIIHGPSLEQHNESYGNGNNDNENEQEQEHNEVLAATWRLMGMDAMKTKYDQFDYNNNYDKNDGNNDNYNDDNNNNDINNDDNNNYDNYGNNDNYNIFNNYDNNNHNNYGNNDNYNIFKNYDNNNTDCTWQAHDATVAPPPAPTQPTTHQLLSHVRHNRYKQVKAALVGGMNVESRDVAGNTLLIVAAQNNLKRMLKLCIRYGADVNAQNDAGNTSLHFARAYSYENVYEWLLRHGATTDCRNNKGLQPQVGVL